MKKLSGGLIALIVILGAVLLIGSMVLGSYNQLVTAREAVSSGQAVIDTQLQRRADLIPNLVSTVKGFAAQEQSVIDSVTEARAQLTGAQTMADKADADAALSGALSRLLVVVENYPELKSDATFISLMDELSGTENRIAVARNDYNEIVRSYNNKIITFPGNIMAGMFGLEKAEYFAASQGAQDVPQVTF